MAFNRKDSLKTVKGSERRDDMQQRATGRIRTRAAVVRGKNDIGYSGLEPMTSHNNSHNSTKWANNSLILPLFKQTKRSHSDAQKSLKYERKSFGDISNVTNFCLPGFKPRPLWKIYICSLINQKRFWNITLVYSNRIFVFFYYLCRIGLSMFCADGSVASLQSLSCVE